MGELRMCVPGGCAAGPVAGAAAGAGAAGWGAGAADGGGHQSPAVDLEAETGTLDLQPLELALGDQLDQLLDLFKCQQGEVPLRSDTANALLPPGTPGPGPTSGEVFFQEQARPPELEP